MSLGAGIVQSDSAAGLAHPGSCCFPVLGHGCQGASLGSEHTANLEKKSLRALMGLGAPMTYQKHKENWRCSQDPVTQLSSRQLVNKVIWELTVCDKISSVGRLSLQLCVSFAQERVKSFLWTTPGILPYIIRFPKLVPLGHGPGHAEGRVATSCRVGMMGPAHCSGAHIHFWEKGEQLLSNGKCLCTLQTSSTP